MRDNLSSNLYKVIRIDYSGTIQSRKSNSSIGHNQKLAERAGVARATLAQFEGGKRTPITNNIEAIRQALESAGVEFIQENGGGAGVRLKRK